MSQRDKIIESLKKHKALSHSALAEAICGDKSKTSNIQESLKKMVRDGLVFKSGGRPSLYSLTSGVDSIVKSNQKVKLKYRDVSGDVISNESIEQEHLMVLETDNYGPENDLITKCLIKYPKNTEVELVALKIGLIDITNSTHLSQHKSKISMVELAEIISRIENIDERIKNGDPEVVSEIARCNGKVNLFSFASKYCCYHNCNLYGNDHYSILDTVLKNYLPLYFPEIKRNTIQEWQDKFLYKDYNDFITRKLDELNISIDHRKRKFDHFIWHKNRLVK